MGVNTAFIILVGALVYSWGIRGVFTEYTYVSGMCRVCIGYVSGKCRRGRGARGVMDIVCR